MGTDKVERRKAVARAAELLRNEALQYAASHKVAGHWPQDDPMSDTVREHHDEMLALAIQLDLMAAEPPADEIERLRSKLAEAYDQARQGVIVEHHCPAMYACAAILADESDDGPIDKVDDASMADKHDAERWIPVSERLPMLESVLGIFEGGSQMVVILDYVTEGWQDSESREPLLIRPTHWMPLPAPPAAMSAEKGGKG